jgi:hypothetical protein
MSLSATVICLIVCHAGPADHFVTFAKKLSEDGYNVQVYASGPALKKLQDRNIEVMTPFSVEGLSQSEEIDLAIQLAKSCSNASVVMTDVGHAFDVTLQKALSVETPQVVRLAYYDNPEPYVPGGYSTVAEKVMQAADKVLFANANLVENLEIKIPLNERVGLGYYPLAQAEKIAARRQEEHALMRSQLFSKYDLKDTGQKIFVYFGGNNDDYFIKAFPAFLSILSEGISDSIVILQQHPGAKSQNIDRLLVEAWMKETGHKVIISEGTTEDMQVLADAALYYQTSMGPQFVLAGIPTIQVGHKMFEDILVRGGLCPSVTSASDFVEAARMIKPEALSEEQRRIILKGLGIRDDWFEVFKRSYS